MGEGTTGELYSESRSLGHGTRKPDRPPQSPNRRCYWNAGALFWNGKSDVGRPQVGMNLMHLGAAARIDNEPFLSTLDPTPARTPVSLTLQLMSEPQPLDLWGTNPTQNSSKGEWLSRLGDNGMGLTR